MSRHSFESLGDEELIDVLAELRSGTHDGSRTPHKPALLLAYLRRGTRSSRFVEYPDIEEAVHRAVERLHGARLKVHYPFWRLQTSGYWEVKDAASYTLNASGDPRVSELRARRAEAGLTAPVFEKATGPNVLPRLVARLVHRAFPQQVESVVLKAFGWSDP